ncbi:uncharacterized protein [Ptychodera flava]|uniref:uncharacterized protein isoform X2 n=1 Tax=Ptychodera flava TaxID=63121 RepID=UPI003969CB6F
MSAGTYMMSSERVTDLETSEIDEQERAQRNETNAQFIFLLKEKEALKREIESKDKELRSLKSKNYDLLKEVEKLESEAEKKKATTTGVRQKDTRKHPVPRQNPRKPTTATTKPATSVKKGGSKSDERDTYKYYTEIAEKFPNIKLSTVISAEKKFVEADVNGNGTIDADELEKLFDRNDFMFTKQQIQEILREVDRDNSEDLDFFECLTVIEKLQMNRKTNLPQSLRNAQGAKSSSVCVVQ